MSNSFSLPSQSAEIFDRLSKGLFISKNAPSTPATDLYRIVESHFESYQAYFQVIGFQLERGDDYFYFSKNETRGQVEDKAEKLFRYLDGLEILFFIQPSLAPGQKFSLLPHADTLARNKSIRKKCLLLPGKVAQEEPIDRVRNFCKSLEKESLLHALDEQQNQFLVLDAFQYLLDFFIKIDQNS